MALAGLIVGLGNPGRKYDGTRHNFGFKVVDRLVQTNATCRAAKGVKNLYELWECELPGYRAPWLVMKPLTYMNLSGDAVARVFRNKPLEPEQILVLHDELDLPLGRMKLKCGGGAAGHNGLLSIAERLGSKNFHRLRLGVGKPAGRDGASFVLSRFTPDESPLVAEVVDAALEAITSFATDDQAMAVQKVNSFRPQTER